MTTLVYGNIESRKFEDTTKSYTGFTTYGCIQHIEIVKLII